MRKRVKIERATKIVSCANGKIVRYAFIALCAIMFGSCASTHKQDEGSWLTYCEKYNVNPDNPTKEQENFYMDCYVGSVEEERDIYGFTSISFDSRNVSEVVNGVFLDNTYYVVYTDSAQGLDHECIAVDIETANLIKSAISSKSGHLRGYLVLDKYHEFYNYNHEIR